MGLFSKDEAGILARRLNKYGAQGFAKAEDKYAMCYRCINTCPKQAITLLGKRVVGQGTIEKYL